MKILKCELTSFEVKAIEIMSLLMYKRMLANKTEDELPETTGARNGLFDLYAKMACADDYMEEVDNGE